MSRYHPISSTPGSKISLAFGGGTAEPITFTPNQPRKQQSFLTRAGGEGTSQERSNSTARKSVGEY